MLRKLYLFFFNSVAIITVAADTRIAEDMGRTLRSPTVVCRSVYTFKLNLFVVDDTAGSCFHQR